MRELISYSNKKGITGNGNGRILGVVKGRTDDIWKTSVMDYANAARIPTALFGPEEGVYSFREALAAIVGMMGHPKDGKWYTVLPRCVKVTADIYEEYRRSLAALVAA